MTNLMKVSVFLLTVLLIGCQQQQPHGKDYIYTQKDDYLSLQGKVDILRGAATAHDDAILTSIALLYAQNKNWVEAKSSISKAIKLNPLDPSYHLYLANYNAELNQNTLAYEEAKIAFELGAYDRNLEALIARMAIETLDSVNGSQFVLKYYDSNKENLDAQLLMARLHLMERKYIEAEELFKIVLKKDSSNFTAWKIAYQTYLKVDSVDLAIDFGNKILEKDSSNALYYFQLAELYESKNKLNLAANYFTKSYRYQPRTETLQLGLRNYSNLIMYDSILFYSDSTFAGINHSDAEILLLRARAFDKKYKYAESYVVYDQLIRMDSTDSVVHAEQQTVQRKIAYLQRKKREQRQLADSLAKSMPTLNF